MEFEIWNFKYYNNVQKTILFKFPFLLLFAFFSCNKNTEYKTIGSDKSDDPYLKNLYLSLNRSPMQERLRNLKPFPVGVVYYQQRGDNLDSAKKEFEVIKNLGFTALKQVQLQSPHNSEDFEKEIFHAAVETGICPWYYGTGGWKNITQQMVDSLGINVTCNAENMPYIQSHPAMISFQDQFWHQRIDKMHIKPLKPKEWENPEGIHLLLRKGSFHILLNGLKKNTGPWKI
ncbi:MAG: hypothetical protein HC906_02310 [Bacteroidales bacterium]|nr:hypothetical protein [Bacteroidales bacterium]